MGRGRNHVYDKIISKGNVAHLSQSENCLWRSPHPAMQRSGERHSKMSLRKKQPWQIHANMLCILLCPVFSIRQITEPTPRGSAILPNYNDNRNFVLFSQGTSKQKLNGSLHKLICIYLKESLHITSNKHFRLPLRLVHDRICFFLLSYAYPF